VAVWGWATSVITHPVHVYTTTGAYTVTLTAYAGAAQDTLTQTNYITVTSGSVEPVLITTTIRYILRSAQDRLYDPLQRLTNATYSDGKSFHLRSVRCGGQYKGYVGVRPAEVDPGQQAAATKRVSGCQVKQYQLARPCVFVVPGRTATHTSSRQSCGAFAKRP